MADITCKKIRRPIQLSLFDVPTFNIAYDQKVSMNEAARNCGLSRDQIVEKMNEMAGRFGVTLVKGNTNSGLTLETFEKWINPEDTTRHMPMKALPIFCAVTESLEPLAIMAKPLEAAIIGQDEKKLLEWAKIKLRQKKEAKTLRRIGEEIE